MYLKTIFLLIFVSLVRIEGVVSNDTLNIVQIDTLNYLSYDLINDRVDRDSILEIANLCLKSSEALAYPEGQFTAHLRLGYLYYTENKSDSAMIEFDNAEHIFNSSEIDSVFLVKVYINKALVARNVGNIDEAIEINQKGLLIAESINSPRHMGMFSINLANALKDKGDIKKALKFFHQSIKLFPTDDYSNLGKIYQNIGNIYHDQHRFEDALEAYHTAQTLFSMAGITTYQAEIIFNIGNIFSDQNQIDSAFYYYDQYKTVSPEDYAASESDIYHNVGNLYLKIGQLDSAQLYLQNSLSLQQEQEIATNQSKTIELLGDSYLLQNQIDTALSLYLMGYEHAQHLMDTTQLEDLSYKLSDIYVRKKDLNSAIKYLNLSAKFQEKNLENINKSLLYEIDYSKNEQRVKYLETADLIQELKEKKRKTILTLGILLAFATLLFFILYIRYILQKRKHLESEKKVTDLMNNQEQTEITAMLDGQEKERTRIATELHDTLGSMLSTVKLYFSSMDKQLDGLKDENKQYYLKANNLLDEACDEVRKISHDLDSGFLSRMGIFKAVKNLQQRIQDSKTITVNLVTHGTDDDLKILNELTIYRIIQELIANTLKHAKATQLDIQLNIFDGIFNLLVEDNGRGFQLEHMKQKDGMGLRSVEARVKKMDGTISIDSGKGNGTTISIDIPLKEIK